MLQLLLSCGPATFAAYKVSVGSSSILLVSATFIVASLLTVSGSSIHSFHGQFTSNTTIIVVLQLNSYY